MMVLPGQNGKQKRPRLPHNTTTCQLKRILIDLKKCLTMSTPMIVAPSAQLSSRLHWPVIDSDLATRPVSQHDYNIFFRIDR